MKKITMLLIFTLILLLFSISNVCASDVNDTAITIDDTDQIIDEVNTELENQNEILDSANEDIVSMDVDSWFYNDVVWYDGDYDQTEHVFIVFADDLQNPENITLQLFDDAKTRIINDDENPEEFTIEYYDCKDPISNVDLAILNNQNFEITKLTTDSNGIATYNIPFDVGEFSFFVGFWYDEYHVANYAEVGKTTYYSCNWGTWKSNKTESADDNKMSGNSKSYDVSSIEELVSALSSYRYSNVIINLKEDIILNTFYDLSPAIKVLTINGNGKTINGFSEYKRQFLEINNDVEVTIQNIRIINCEASYGAVIYNSGNGKLTVVNSVFENNDVLRYGGVIYNSGHNSIIRNCTFRNNFASKGLDSTGVTILGGAIYNNADNVTITDSIFEDNTVKTRAWGVDDRTIEGGAIYSMGDNVRITGNVFRKNSADNGAAIYTYGDDILIDSNTFKLNNAVSSSRDEAIIYMYRGGFYKDIEKSKNIFVTDTECYSTIFHYAYGGSAVITNNVFDDRLDTIISADNVVGEYLNSKVSATFLDNDGKTLASRQVSFNVGDKTYTAATNANGVATANVDLGAGTYTVTAINPVNNEQKQFQLTISKADSKIALDYSPNNGVFTLTATLTPATATGNVVFSVNGQNKNSVIKNGKATFVLSDLEPGDYTVTASYNGDSNFKSSASNAVNFTVEDVYFILTANDLTKTYGTSNKLVVNLVDSKGNAVANAVVNVNIKNKITPITTGANGKASMPISLKPATYNAIVTYADTQDMAKVVVKKATPKITAAKKTYKVSVKTKKYTITLKANGKALKSKKVYLKINKKTFAAKTGSNGKATFKITNLKKKGTFAAIISFKADSYYNKATKTVKITAKK